MAEARHFPAWQLDRGGAANLKKLGVRDIDLYMDGRAPGLRRKSLRDYAERLRSVLRYMHRTGPCIDIRDPKCQTPSGTAPFAS